MAAVDYYLKLGSIDGESTDAKHKIWIDIESFSWGVTNPGNAAKGGAGGGGGGGQGKASFFDVFFSARAGKQSPLLFLNTANGGHLKSAVLEGVKRGSDSPTTFVSVKLTELLITSHKQDVLGGRLHDEEDHNTKQLDVGTLMDQFTLNFAKIEVTFTTQNEEGGPGGSTSASWDRTANK